MKKFDLVPVFIVFIITIGLMVFISRDLYKTIVEIAESYSTITANYLKPPG